MAHGSGKKKITLKYAFRQWFSDSEKGTMELKCHRASTNINIEYVHLSPE